MRILLVQTSSYFPSFAGGDKSDRLMLAKLASRGHQCQVIARAQKTSQEGHSDCLRIIEERGIKADQQIPGILKFRLDSVEIHVATTRNLLEYLTKQLEIFDPNVTLVSTDPLNILILHLTNLQIKNVIYLARTTMLLPFGPESAFPSALTTEAIRRATSVITVSRYLADYVVQHSGIAAHFLPIQLMENDDWPLLGNINNDFVTMINPCALKGIDIFLGLADAFGHIRFAAVPTWGTTSDNRLELASRPNVSILNPADDIRSILEDTRVILVPSLWAEAKSRLISEALLSGIPVLASDRGGNREATLGVGCLLPVNPIVAFKHSFDQQMIREPEVPFQDLEPWKASLHQLLDDPLYYAELAKDSRAAAIANLRTLTIEPFESMLKQLASVSADGRDLPPEISTI